MSFNLLSAKLFGELEFWFAIIKIVTIIALIVIGVIMILFAFKTPFGNTSLTHLYQHGIFQKELLDSLCHSKWHCSHLLVLK